MASSSSSATRASLASYLAGETSAERVVAVVAEAYYRGGGAERERLQPLIDVIERAAPGVVGLSRTAGGAGFEIQLVERPFPKREESRLRLAAERVLAELGGAGASMPPSPVGEAGVLARLLRAVRRLFSASA